MAVPASVVEASTVAMKQQLQLARQSANVFVEFVMRDEHLGVPLVQSAVQKEWHRLAGIHDRLVIWSSVESGKALPLDTPIPTPAGWRTMGELRVGDEVFDSAGASCRVTYVTPTQVDRKLFRVVFDDGAEQLADEDHQWIAKTDADAWAGRGWRVVTTSQMSEKVTRPSGARRRDGTRYSAHQWRIPLAGAVEYPERDLPVHPYVLGYWLGNGSSCNSQITCAEADRCVYDRCIQLEGGDCPPRIADGVLEGVVGGFVDKRRNKDGTSLRHRLRRLGVLHERKGGKHIPVEYLTSSISQRLELLAGLLDSDGSSDKKGRVEFCSCTQRLAEGTLELIRSLGFKASMTNSPAKLYGRTVGTRYRINFTPGSPVFWLPRKLARQRLQPVFGRAGYRCIKAITRVPSVPVRCISVDSVDQSYLCGRSYTVTHNTQQVSIARTLWILGRDPQARIAIISNTGGQAEKIVRSIARYIEQSAELHMVFPALRPSEPWSGSQLVIQRDTVSKDPSVQACGVHGNILGARIDYLILDDVLDYENCRTPGMRKDLWDWYHATLAGRLTANATVTVIGTAFHPEDMLHRLAKLNRWKAVRFPALNEDGSSRWPAQWPIERIEKKREELGPLEFARQMMCVARDDTEARFKKEWIDIALRLGDGKSLAYGLSSVPRGCRTYTGVDLAVSKKDSADLTCLFTLIVHPNGQREVLDIDSDRWSGQEIIDHIRSVHDRYHSVAIVENNAAQDFLVQFMRGQNAVPVRPFTTGRNKTNLEFGVESIAAEMAGGQWIIPNTNGRVSSGVSEWIAEMLYYDPKGHTGDRLMASWLAREGARMGARVIQSGRIELTRR